MFVDDGLVMLKDFNIVKLADIKKTFESNSVRPYFFVGMSVVKDDWSGAIFLH